MTFIAHDRRPVAPSTNLFRELVSTLLRHRQLTWEMARREVTDRYAGQMFGALWAVGHPLLVMAVYLFIFAFVFKVRIGGTQELPLDYTVYLLSGLIPWLAMQEAINKGSVAVSNNASLVKQVVFPVEILPVKTVLASLPTQLVSLVILTVYVIATYGRLPWTYVFLPVLLVAQVMLASGLGYFLSAVGVYFRDLKDVIQVLTLVGMYMLPVFYLPNMVPPLFRPLLYLNPFSYLIWCYQDVCYFGRFEHPWAWAVMAVFVPLTLFLGFGLFRRLKPMFGNVL